MENKKIIKQNLIAIVVLIVLTVAILILSKFEEIAEFLTTHIYFEWAIAFNHISSNISFNLFEVEAFIFVALILGLIIFSIVQFVHKYKDLATTLFTTAILCILIVAFLYSLIVAPIYNRKSLDLKEEETLLTSEEAVLRTDKFFDDFAILAASQDLNEDGTTKCPYTDEELEAKIKEEFKRLTSDYYCSVEAEPKRVISSYLMSAFSIAGITYMPNVEPCYNTQMLSQDIAITCAHEIAHTKGIMRENDANEVAYYILLTSSDNYLRYVGYLKTMAYMNRVYKLNNIDVGTSKIPACAMADYRASRQFWDEKGVMEKVGDAINSLYLKLNSQDGTDSYNSYDNYESETIIDEDGNKKDVYTVTSYSHVQNMIFALYQ